MILVDREDFEGHGFQESLFFRKWIPGEPEALERDYADVPALGPFLIKANDVNVWMSHDGEGWVEIAHNPRHDGPEKRRWSHLTTLYAQAGGLSLRQLIVRIVSIRDDLKETPGRWIPWSSTYWWPEGSDLIWSGLTHHPRLETRMHNNEKEVRYVGQ